ncbi:MAG: YqhA family protein [Actinobacteria bacterium]|nr:YqhA family protein [Actinomycetota bacterium]
MAEERPELTERQQSGVIARMVASSRFFVLVATVILFLAFMAVMVSTIVTTVTAILDGLGGGVSQNEMIGKLIKQADYALLAMVLYVLALGLYSLFVDDRVPMPAWLRIRDLGNLKELLAGVVVVAIAVIFLGWALTWDGESDILALGLACAAVIGGLAVFLWQAARERQLIEKERRRELEEERRGISPGAAAGSEPRDD